MSKLIHKEAPSTVIGVVSDVSDYVSARKQIEQEAREHGLQVADLPLIIASVGSNQQIREAIRSKWIDAVTSEVQANRSGDNAYQVQHSTGDLSSVSGLVSAKKKIGDYGFMPVDFIADSALVFTRDELRKGNFPSAGTPYAPTLWIPEGHKLIPRDTDDKTVYAMHKAGELVIYETGQLSFDQARMDDRFLAVAGSPENVETIIKVMVDEGYQSVGSYHRIAEIGFPEKSWGRPAFWDDLKYRLDGYSRIHNNGRFFGGRRDGVASAGGADARKIVTLDDTLENVPDEKSFRAEMGKYLSPTLVDQAADTLYRSK